MRRKDREVTDPAEINKIIAEAKVCHLAMVDDGEPYVVPVNFGYDNNCLYFHCALQGRKIDILKRDNRVCFNIIGSMEVTDAASCKVRYRSATGTGTAAIVTDNEEKIRGIRAVMKQITGVEFDIPRKSLDTTLVVRIDIREMKGKKAG
jgi:hypothetical protein